jgi:hypothetical protein
MKLNNFIILIVILLALIMIILSWQNFKGEVIKERQVLGYCPTMISEAIEMSHEYNLVLKEYVSASEVLNELSFNNIDLALVGRKAYSYEILDNIQEKTLESGFTLVSNKRGFIDASQLYNHEIYIPLDYIGFVNSNLIYNSSEELKKLIYRGNLVLISWEHWQDDFELVVLTNGSNKVRDLRGSFLYFY